MIIPIPPTRQQLQAINQHTKKYPLDIAEKDYYLCAALSILAQSPLVNMLVFKGGTALHHCYLPQYRFSEDLDFSCLRKNELEFDQVQATLEHGGLFEVRKKYISPATFKIERLRYAGILDQMGAIKVEIDHLQNVVLEPQMLPYHNIWNIPIELPVMDIRELAAEKLRAASQRSRYRDFYDLYLIFEQYAPLVDELVQLLRQKEVRRSISTEGLRENWLRASQEYAEGIGLIYYSRKIALNDIAQLVSGIQFSPILASSG